jgi:sirohydrochlorin cobaltochelatase
MKSIIVLAMHGAPPRDFPRAEMGEFMSLHSRMGHSAVSHSPALECRYEELEKQVREWPRTPANDPFSASSQDIATALEKAAGQKVMVGFNEFCAPALDDALERAASSGAERVVVVTPMMTRGGEHSEKDILQAVEKARSNHKAVKFVYAWPFETSEVAEFLAEHVKKFEKD